MNFKSWDELDGMTEPQLALHGLYLRPMLWAWTRKPSPPLVDLRINDFLIWPSVPSIRHAQKLIREAIQSSLEKALATVNVEAL